MTISTQDFRTTNRLRSRDWHRDTIPWGANEWNTAFVGEVGEAANVLKKINRVRHNAAQRPDETLEELYPEWMTELVDAYIYLDLLIEEAEKVTGLDFDEFLVNKFNRTSEEFGFTYRLNPFHADDHHRATIIYHQKPGERYLTALTPSIRPDFPTRVLDPKQHAPEDGTTTAADWAYMNENNPCGAVYISIPTMGYEEAVVANDQCRCGCAGDDTRCAYFLMVYSATNDQVRPEHTCCQIPGRTTAEPLGTAVRLHKAKDSTQWRVFNHANMEGTAFTGYDDAAIIIQRVPENGDLEEIRCSPSQRHPVEVFPGDIITLDPTWLAQQEAQTDE